MWHFNWIYGLLFVFAMLGCSAESSPKLKAEHYIIVIEKKANNDWGDYLFRHLSKRVSDTSIVTRSNDDTSSDANCKIIRFSENSAIEEDYCIKHSEKELTISVKNKEVGIWMIYQLIAGIAQEDSRFHANDLLPPTISFLTQCRKFDFEYREPYFSPNLQEDYASVNGNHTIENTWGLWGHNLPKIIKSAPQDIYATLNGKRDNRQFCFSSPELLAEVSDYILDAFGNKSLATNRFMIMPNDNDIVCLCSKCQKAGNTKNNATPAVSLFISKLANRFPAYTFFTSAYRTTSSEPQQQLPENSGVMFSTISLQKGVKLNEENSTVKQFIQQLEAWKTKTKTIYIWDYASNFDDYLTPLPVLKGMQKQFRFFKKYGVKGVFLNGSGYDYSPFNDLQTYIAGALMKDTEIDIDRLSLSFFNKKYPSTAGVLNNYYGSLEKKYEEKNKPFNIYGGMKENLKTYLDATEFVRFYEQLPKLIDSTKGEERSNLKKMHTALSFTRLQIAHTKGSEDLGYAVQEKKTLHIKSEVKEWVNTLELHSNYQDINTYKEAEGELQKYVAEWQNIIATDSFQNQLLNIPIQLLSKPDEDFEKTGTLNDGVTGFANDYHIGWYISSTDDLYVSFPAERLQNCNTIRLRFLNMIKYGFTSPEKIEISVDGIIVKTLTEKENNNNENNVITFNTEISFKEARNITLKCYRKKQEKSIIACDEIQLF